MGQKIANMLYNEGVKNVTIMNRTVEKAKQLALKFGYNYEKLDLDKLGSFDIAFISISHENLRLENKWNTLIVDITVPPYLLGIM